MYYLILHYMYINKSFPYDACDFSTINHYVVIRSEFFYWLLVFFCFIHPLCFPWLPSSDFEGL